MLSYLSFKAGSRNRCLGDWPMERGKRLCCTFDGNHFYDVESVTTSFGTMGPFRKYGCGSFVDVQPIEKVEKDLLQI
jgi:hypothetical protein